MNKVIIISGATATGKSDLAVQIAKRVQGEVVNFDSLLFYQELNIGTAKPSPEELKAIPHHLVSSTSINNPINAADFAKEAIGIIEQLHQKNKIVILVGGSGFYLQALLKGMFDSKTTPLEITQKSEALYQEEGILPFLKILKEHDQKSFELYHENDHYRIRRAVEHFWTTGDAFSHSRQQMDLKKQNAPENNWDIKHYYLHIEKEKHWDIILKRTKKMILAGLIEEVRSLLNQGFDLNLKPLKSIGYKETIDYLLTPEHSNQEELIEKIYIATRRLAKAQRTWFNKVEKKKTINPLIGFDEVYQEIELWLKKS